MGLPNPSRETKFSGANADKEYLIFLFQLTPSSRIGNLTRLIHTLATYMCGHACTQHAVNCLRPFSFWLFFCFFGDVAFSEYLCTIAVLSLFGEYVVRFILPDGVFFYLVTTGWIFDIIRL